ncbi:threonylcarbamoyl-AMP synthase [archaeon]|nr:threonylcarbamoyl-AMP synthase [archaeon]
MTGETIREAVRVLGKGGLVIYPTETCYGLGADATNPAAIKKVFRVKKRPKDKPLSVIVDSLEMIKSYAVIPRGVERLVDEYMPAPLTLVVKNKSFPSTLCGGGDKVGFRIPDHVVALELVRQFDKPIIATSANLSGGPNPYTVPDLPVDFVINYGELPRVLPSTVYDTILKKTIREGPVKIT